MSENKTPINEEKFETIEIPKEHQEVFLAKLSDAGQVVYPAQLRENSSVEKLIPEEYLARPGDRIEMKLVAIRRPKGE